MAIWPALLVVLVAGLAAVELGQVPLRLPFPPGVEYDYMAEPPPGELPPKWDKGFAVTNEDLRGASYVLRDRVRGAETVALAPDGRLGLVDRFGKIFVATPDGSGGYSVPDEPLAWSSPGRTLGVKWGPDGSLYMANAPLGLLQLVAPGDVEAQKLLLATGRVSDDSPLKPGHPIEFANSLDIGADGTVYLSSSTDVLPYKTADGHWDATDSAWVSLAKGDPSGMLLAHHPSNGSTTCLLDKLWYGNGVSLSHDESYVLVADSLTFRLVRYWLKGPKAGTSDVWADNLPGHPDGISRAQDGQSYWVTIYCAPPSLVAFSGSRLMRLLMAYSPRIIRALKLPLPHVGLVLRYNGDGQVVQVLGDPGGKVVAGVTSAFEDEQGRLFLGSLHTWGVPVLDLTSLPKAS